MIVYSASATANLQALASKNLRELELACHQRRLRMWQRLWQLHRHRRTRTNAHTHTRARTERKSNKVISHIAPGAPFSGRLALIVVTRERVFTSHVGACYWCADIASISSSTVPFVYALVFGQELQGLLLGLVVTAAKKRSIT